MGSWICTEGHGPMEDIICAATPGCRPRAHRPRLGVCEMGAGQCGVPRQSVVPDGLPRLVAIINGLEPARANPSATVPPIPSIVRLMD